MILALAGLHGSGKSHLARVVAAEHDWSVTTKRSLLKVLHENSGNEGDWVEWYRSEYASRGAYEVTRSILNLIPDSGDTILDSVHNIEEWAAIADLRPDAALALVVAPKIVRAERNAGRDPRLDERRIAFWHGDGDGACLAAACSWSFNGAAPREVLRAEFISFLSCCRTR